MLCISNRSRFLVTIEISALGGETALKGHITSSPSDEDFHIYLPKNFGESGDTLSEDIRWYVEDYARNDPFSLQRSQSVESRLQLYGTQLAHAICKSDAVLKYLLDSDVVIEVDGRGGYSHQFSSLHWEILEDLSLWNANVRPQRVAVVRKFHRGSIRPETLPKETSHNAELNATPQNVLAITARPNVDSDIPHRMITRSILEAVQDCKQQTLTFTIIRPGTFEALREVLYRQDPGYYGIVHLDLHGFAHDERYGSLAMMLHLV